MIESDADRLAGIKTLGGVAARVRGETLWGIFDNGTRDALDLVESRDPSLLCRTSDVQSLPLSKDEVITIDEDTYRVKRLDPDGTGMTTVVLKK